MASTEGRTGQPEQGQKVNPAETVIYINSAKRHVPDLEAHLRALRARHGWSVYRLIKYTLVNRKRYQLLESEEAEHVGPNTINKVVNFIGKMCEADEPHAVEAVTLLSALRLGKPARRRISDLIDDARFTGQIVFTEKTKPDESIETPSPLYSPETEQRWYNIIEQSSFKEIITRLRETEKISRIAFAKEVGISRMQLYDFERGVLRDTRSFTANKIISWAPFDDLGKAAQLLRLKSQGKKPMDTDSLRQLNLGELMRYLRTNLGYSQEKLAEILKISESRLRDIEAYNKKPRRPAEFAKTISLWLGEEPINDIFQLKIKDPDALITDDLANSVLSGKFLFVKEDLTLAA